MSILEVLTLSLRYPLIKHVLGKKYNIYLSKELIQFVYKLGNKKALRFNYCFTIKLKDYLLEICEFENKFSYNK